jgi:hypothetical protein
MDTIRAKTEDLASRVEALTGLLTQLEQQVQSLLAEGEIAPPRCWLTRYQARGKTKNYWYYKWQSQEPIFPTTKGKKTRYKHLGKAGSQAYLEAVTLQVRRATFEGLQQAISTLKAGLADLSEEAAEKSN